MWRTFGRFNLVSAMGALVQLATIGALVEGFGAPYLPATVAAVGIAIAHNFAWHQRWTWRGRTAGRRRVTAALARFVAANGLVSMAGNVVLMAALTGQAGIPALPANAAAIVVCGCLNFWLGDRLVFPARGRIAAQTSVPTTSR